MRFQLSSTFSTVFMQESQHLFRMMNIVSNLSDTMGYLATQLVLEGTVSDRSSRFEAQVQDQLRTICDVTWLVVSLWHLDRWNEKVRTTHHEMTDGIGRDGRHVMRWHMGRGD